MKLRQKFPSTSPPAMNTTRTCQSCGAPLAGTASDESYCPACFLRQGLLTGSDSQPSMPVAEKPAAVFGSYELIEEIGRGGMGVVYKARQRNLKRTVAVKLLVSGAYSSESLLRRFQIEAESAAGLHHPGIVAIHEFGEQDNQPFYTMDYVEGRNLAEVSGGQPLEPRRAATYVRAIAEAVQYAHSRDILHRDLKPSNILIDADDRPRITDFGLAKQLHGQSDVSVAGQMLGSPNYSSPEQSAGEATIGIASDIYSLGALLYHLLTGRPPFLASTMQETLRLVHETEPVSPHVLNPDVPQDLDTICLKCLEKSGAKRYASAQELADELGRFLQGEPIHARPVSSVERGWRWCRRHPAIATLSVVVVLALTATSVTFYTSARRIDRARLREQHAREEAEKNLYAANMEDMSRALTSLIGVDPRATREGLDLSRPKSDGPDHRGFEWRYFWRKIRSDALATLSGHSHVVDAVFFSPDGTRLATHSLDGTLKLWDAGTMGEIQSLDGVARPAGFTPDSRRFVFGKPDGSCWQFDLAARSPTKLQTAVGPMLALHPDGVHVVVLGADALPVLRALDATGDQTPGIEISPNVCATLSADGRRAAVASPPGHPYPAILVIDLCTRQQLAAIVDPRPVIGLALSPDGRVLVTSGFDGILKVWDVEHGVLLHGFKAFIDPVWGLAFSPDGRSFAAGGHNREVKIWDTNSWAETEVLSGHSSTIHCIAFSPDGRRLVSGAEDELALVWPAHANRLPEEMPQLLRGPQWIDRTPGLAFSPDSRLVTGTAADGTIKVWRTDTMATVATYAMDARTVAFSPDGRSVLGEGYDGVIRRWMVSGEQPAEIFNPKASFANWQVDSLTPLERVTFVADRAAARVECRLCEIPSARDGINAGAIMSTPTIAISPDGRTMFVGLPQGRVEARDVATRQRRYSVAAHKLNVTALAVSADGRLFASGSLDNSTKLWDAATGRHIATVYAHNRPVWALAFSPDGNILAAALGDGTVRFFRAAPFSETDKEVTPITTLASK